jgi:hypothetical protein
VQINARLVEQESSILAAIFSLAFAAGLFCLYFLRTPLDTTILATHLQEFKTQSTRPQFYFYLVLLSSVVTLCLRMLLRPQIKFFWAGRNSTSELLAILVITIAIVLGWRADRPFIVGLLLVAG